MLLLLVATGIAAGAVAKAGQQRPAEPCNEPLPPDTGAFDESIWGDTDPWVFAQPDSKPLTVIRLSDAVPASSGRVRLNDGSEGTLRVEFRPCRPSENCPGDGCLGDENYRIGTADGRGRALATFNVCAPYRSLQVVPVDLVDGPGDEILIVRIRGHASPPLGSEVRIWRVGPGRPAEIGVQQISGRFSSVPIAEAGWKASLWIDRRAPKPRAITLRTRIGAKPGTRLCDQSEVAAVKRLRTLELNAATGKYKVNARLPAE